VSFDDGASWRRWQLNLPTTPIHDLVVKDNTLVVATHGRSFWVLDSLGPLRQFSDELAKKDFHLYAPDPAYRMQAGAEGPAQPSKLTGQNPAAGALIYYWMKDAPKPGSEVKVEILDASGGVVRTYSSEHTKLPDEPLDPDDRKPEKELKPEAGLNSILWDLHHQGAHRVPGYYLWAYGKGGRGPLAVPGAYQVRVTVAGQAQTAPLEVRLDPRVSVSPADLEQQFAFLRKDQDELNRVYDSVNQIEDVRAQLAGMKARLPVDGSARSITESAEALDKQLVELRKQFINLDISANEDSLAYPPQLDAKLAYLAVAASSADSAPTAAEQAELEKLEQQGQTLLSRWSDLQSRQLADFQKAVAAKGLSSILVPPPGQVTAGTSRAAELE